MTAKNGQQVSKTRKTLINMQQDIPTCVKKKVSNIFSNLPYDHEIRIRDQKLETLSTSTLLHK